MAREIMIDPKGGAVSVLGEIVEPAFAPLKIDVWRHVRHPPPDVVHAYSVKALNEESPGFYNAGTPAALIGKVLTFSWICDDVRAGGPFWRVRIDVQQDGASVPGYPVEYKGPLPEDQPLAELRISELVRALS